MITTFKYFTEAKGRGANRPGSERCEAILTDWFETPATIEELRVKYGAKVCQSITRVIFRAIKRKPELAGLKDVPSNLVIDNSNFDGGVAKGRRTLKPEVKEAIIELRQKGLTYKQIGFELNICRTTAYRHINDIDYRADRADPTEPYGQPHA